MGERMNKTEETNLRDKWMDKNVLCYWKFYLSTVLFDTVLLFFKVFILFFFSFFKTVFNELRESCNKRKK